MRIPIAADAKVTHRTIAGRACIVIERPYGVDVALSASGQVVVSGAGSVAVAREAAEAGLAAIAEQPEAFAALTAAQLQSLRQSLHDTAATQARRVTEAMGDERFDNECVRALHGAMIDTYVLIALAISEQCRRAA